MSTEQERAAFEAWAASIGFCVTGKYAETIDVLCAESAFKAGYQAGRAALQTQDREDAERLDWIEANHGCDIAEFADGTWEVDVPDGPCAVGNGMREAIDNARRIEGNGE